MKRNEFLVHFLSCWNREPTTGQREAMEIFTNYMFSRAEYPLMLLSGYAGTGKTTLTAAFVQLLDKLQIKNVLLAPTGRAAKVMSLYAEKEASTIHRRIYYTQTDGGQGFGFKRQINFFKNTVFLVDESSMIGGKSEGLQNSLLEDLLDYVYNGQNCRLVLIGDSAQLPPVGCQESPALQPAELSMYYPFEIHRTELKEVVRQEADSGILYNATLLRVKLYSQPDQYPGLDLNTYADIRRIGSDEFQDLLEACYARDGQNQTVVICRSNKRTLQFNMQIRNRILWREELLCKGDRLMIVKNNYTWLKDQEDGDFLANGEMVEVMNPGKEREIYGLKFQEPTLRLQDSEEGKDFQALIFSDLLGSEEPVMAQTRMNELALQIAADYPEITNKKKLREAVKSNAFYQALQVKYAYAITCHKAQGGQWKNVFVDLGYFLEEMLNEEFYRWLYTAFTRASASLYLVNFKDEFFQNEE